MLGTRNEAIIVTTPWAEDGTFDVIVEVVARDGHRRRIAEVVDFGPGGMAEAALAYPYRVLASATGWLALVVESPAGSNQNHVALLDLLDLTRPPRVLQANSFAGPMWGPGDRLAVAEEERGLILVVVPETGETTSTTVPPNVSTSAVWIANGSGWLATRQDGADETVGVLRLDGSFWPGQKMVYARTGVESPVSAAGTALTFSEWDGPLGAGLSVDERGPDLDRHWYTFREPSDDPRLVDVAWDAQGIGLWLVTLDAGTLELSHHVRPEAALDVRARWPSTGGTSFAGLAWDDSSIVLSVDLGADGDRPGLLWVDTATGEVLDLGAPPNDRSPPPFFAGWAAD